jgi:phosphoglycolate phosphatase-like HAD superfamily hydrolase
LEKKLKVAIVDLDDVIADPSVRRKHAEEARELLLTKKPEEKKEAESAFYKTLFTSELVESDTLIPGALNALERLTDAGYQIILMSSRPESMRAPTVAWLRVHGFEITSAEIRIPGVDWLILCAPAFRNGYTKTVIWKAGIVETLVRLFAVDDLLFVDDTEKNLEAVRNADLPCSVRTFLALDEI